MDVSDENHAPASLRPERKPSVLVLPPFRLDVAKGEIMPLPGELTSAVHPITLLSRQIYENNGA